MITQIIVTVPPYFVNECIRAGHDVGTYEKSNNQLFASKDQIAELRARAQYHTRPDADPIKGPMKDGALALLDALVQHEMRLKTQLSKLQSEYDWCKERLEVLTNRE